MKLDLILEGYRKKIDQALFLYLDKKIKEFPDFSNQHIKEQWRLIKEYCLRGGKRIRPVMTLLGYKAAYGKDEESIFTSALAFELYHNYTLIHDDIYDEDEMRRNRTANHVLFQRWYGKKYDRLGVPTKLYKDKAARFGAVAGIINGKYLHTLSSFPILESDISEDKKILGMKLHQSVSIYDNTGQGMDLGFEEEKFVSEKDYYNMVLCKTGQLFKASLQWGAVLGAGTESQLEHLGKYAQDIAIAFQIKDDLLDIDQKGGKGHEIGSDIKKGKKTLLAIKALSQAGENDKKKILAVLGKPDSSKKDIKEIIDIFYRLGAVSYCNKKALFYAQKAKKELKKAKPALEKEAEKILEELAFYVFERKK